MADKPDYRAILTQLYQRYNPEKVRDVDFLLKKFEGREGEMIDKIQRKYADLEPFTSPVSLPIEPETNTPVEPSLTTNSEEVNLGIEPESHPEPSHESSNGLDQTSIQESSPESGSSSSPKPLLESTPEVNPIASSSDSDLDSDAPRPKPKAKSKERSAKNTRPKPKTKTLKKGKPNKETATRARSGSPQTPTRKRKSGRRILGFSLLGLLVGAGAFAAWYFWGGESPIVKRQFLYVVADTVFSHNVCDQGLESRITPFPYGKGIEVHGLEESCITTRVNGNLEYVPKKFLGSAREFEEIDAIYGNAESRDLFDNSYEKRALRNYFNRTQIMGEIPHKKQIELYGQPKEREVWQVYGVGIEEEEEKAEMDAVAKGKFSWSKTTEATEETNRPDDFAVIISERENRDRRKLLLFNFDEEKVDNFVDEMDLSNYPGFLIRPINYKEEIFLFGTPYLRLDAEREDEEEEINLALLLQKPGIEDHRYLIEVVQGELQLFSLDKGLFKMYKKDRVFQP